MPAPGRSLAELRPDLAAQWHPTRNGDLDPGSIGAGSDKEVWWTNCDADADHTWMTTIASRTRREEPSCAVCSGNHIQVGKNDLATTRPDLAAQWHPTKNEGLTPQMITAGSGKEVWWTNCPVDSEHEWLGSPAARSSKLRPRGCAICTGQQVQVGKNDLATTRPDLAAQP